MDLHSVNVLYRFLKAFSKPRLTKSMKSKMPRIIIPILTEIVDFAVVDIAVVSVLVVVKVGGKVVVVGLVEVMRVVVILFVV